MIYKDVYDFLYNKCSSKEFDIALRLINSIDWNSNVHINYYKLANETKTTVRYVREIIKKFNNPKGDKRILSRTIKPNTYKLLIGKPSVLYQKGERYGKKFLFLYSENIQGLSIYAKRILLDFAMKLSNLNVNQTTIDVKSLINGDEIGKRAVPSKAILLNVTNEINTSFKGKLDVSFVTGLFNRKESLIIDVIDPDIINTLTNISEKVMLREFLYDNGITNYVHDDICIEIEKVGKYIFNSFFNLSKDISKSNNFNNVVDDSFDIARLIYLRSIKESTVYLSDIISSDVFETGEVSAYLSSVAFSVASEELVKFKQRYTSAKELIDSISGSLDSNELLYTKCISNLLEIWCQEWVLSRLNGIKEPSSFEKKQKAELRYNKLYEYIGELNTRIQNVIHNHRNKYLDHKKILDYWDEFRGGISDLIDVKLNGLQDLPYLK